MNLPLKFVKKIFQKPLDKFKQMCYNINVRKRGSPLKSERKGTYYDELYYLADKHRENDRGNLREPARFISGQNPPELSELPRGLRLRGLKSQGEGESPLFVHFDEFSPLKY